MGSAGDAKAKTMHFDTPHNQGEGGFLIKGRRRNGMQNDQRMISDKDDLIGGGSDVIRWCNGRKKR